MSQTVSVSNIALLSLRWVARIGSIISIAIILLFFVGEGFNPSKVTRREWLGLFLFPVGVAIGMILAWWKEGWGGGIALASLLAFYLVYGLLLTGRLSAGPAFILFTAPAFLFIAHWLLARKMR